MKILSNAEYADMLGKASMLEHYNAQLRREVQDLQRRPRPPEVPTPEVVIKVRIEQHVFDALAKELPKPCVPKSELEAGVLLGVQMVLERIRHGWVI